MVVPARLGPAPPVLVGRSRELDLLSVHLTAALAGNGRLVLIAGDAGIGKTALADTLCAEGMARGATVLSGRSYDLTETPPYGPWQEIFSQCPASPDLPDLPPFFTADGTAEPIHNQATLFARIRAFLQGAAAQTPLVIMLDDIQWADRGSLDLLRVLARDLDGYSVLLVATYRAGDLEATHPLAQVLPLLVREAQTERFTLRPLGDAAVETLLAARYGALGDDTWRLTSYLRSHAEGNPFFIGELLHTLEDDGRLVRVGATWVLGELTQHRVPPLLRQVIERRIARLGDQERRLLTVAAVTGPEVPLALWQAVSEVEEAPLLDLVERAVAVQVLHETADGAAVTFAHALIRETLYEGVLGARRRVWHTRIAEALIAEPDPDPDAVADHLRHAGDARAADWLIRAGDRASRSFAYHTAVARFTDALALMGDDAAHAVTRCEVLIRLARLLRITDTARAIQYEEEALELATQAQDAVREAVARFRLGYLLSYVGQRQRGLALQLEGLAVLDALPVEAMTRVASLEVICADFTSRHGSVAQRLVHVGRLRDAGFHAERALDAVGGRLNNAAEDAWMARAIMDRDMGRSEEGWLKSRALHLIFRDRGEHDIATWLIGSPLIWAALIYETDDRRRLDEMRALVDAHTPQPGELFATLPIRLLHLPMLYVEGAWTEARQIIEAVHGSPYARHGYTYGAWLVHALIAVAQGEHDIVWAMVHEEFPSGAATEPGNNRYDVSVFLQRIAVTLALEEGDLGEAESWLAAHDRWLAWSGAVLGLAEGHLLWARYHRALGDVKLAAEQANHALTHATEPHQPLVLLATHRLLGELDTAAGRYDAAEPHFDAARILADACHAPYERAVTLLAMAELRAATGDPATARALLDEAYALLTPLAARPALARVAFLADRLTTQPAPLTPRHPDKLTAREVKVLRLLASGQSNRAIAVALGINGRTVERHISNIYTKIGANNRAEAAAYAVRKGIL